MVSKHSEPMMHQVYLRYIVLFAVFVLNACASWNTPSQRGFYPSFGVTTSWRQGPSLELAGRYGRLGKHGNDGYYLALGGHPGSEIFYVEGGTAAQGWLVWDGQASDIPVAMSLGTGPRFSLDDKKGGHRFRGVQFTVVGFIPLLMFRVVQDVTDDGRHLWFGELGIKAWFP